MGTALERRQIRAERISLAPATPCRARVAIRRSRSNDFASARASMTLKKLMKDKAISEDDEKRH